MYIASFLCESVHAPCRLITCQITGHNACIDEAFLESSLSYSPKLILIGLHYVRTPRVISLSANRDIAPDFLILFLHDRCFDCIFLIKLKRKYHSRFCILPGCPARVRSTHMLNNKHVFKSIPSHFLIVSLHSRKWYC